MEINEGFPDSPYFPGGVNAVTGGYVLPPVKPADLAAAAMRESTDKGLLEGLKTWVGGFLKKSHLGPKQGTDPGKLSQSGWGVIFHSAADEALRDALSELLVWRRSLAGDTYREYFGANGYRTGETKQEFLGRFRAGPGPADPQKVPYYLLLVGDPQVIPFEFEYALDVQYAVGRIYFDQLEDYARYAHSVVLAERQNLAHPQRVSFFGVRNPDDTATQLSADYLVAGLADKVRNSHPTWQVDSYLAEQATKARFGQLIGAEDGPAVLFSASHGLVLPCGHALQKHQQGAVICQEWRGPKAGAPIQGDCFYSAGDLASDQTVQGRLLFFFACYGAGTPQMDSFPGLDTHQPGQISPQPFLAMLPQRLLAHPKGGALALISHIDRTWSVSFSWAGAGLQLAVFEGLFNSLLNGDPVGFAVEGFNSRYAELTVDLNDELARIRRGFNPDRNKLAYLWTAASDARSYVIVGDPAVRLQVDRPAESGQAALVGQLQADSSGSIELHQPRSEASVDQATLNNPIAGEQTEIPGLIDILSRLKQTLSQAQNEVDRITQQLTALPGSLDAATEVDLTRDLEKYAVEIAGLLQAMVEINKLTKK